MEAESLVKAGWFQNTDELILEQLDPSQRNYSLREHFLFWRLDGLSLARAYAVLYLPGDRRILAGFRKETYPNLNSGKRFAPA